MRDYGWGYGEFTHVFGFIIYGLFALLSVAVAVAVIFFLVRFLIYGTKAAQLYIAKNSPAKPAAAAPAEPTPAPAPATPAPSPAAAPSAPATAPAASDNATTAVLPPVEVPPADAAPKTAPKATPPITPPTTKKPPVKKTPQPPVV